MKEYDVSIETYMPAQPLRSIATLFNLILKANEDSDLVPMSYTSIVKGDENKSLDLITKKKMDLILSLLKKGQIPALGIVGKDPDNTPGRDLYEDSSGDKKPEKHLSLEELTYNFNRILTGKNIFRIHNVFALDSIDTLKMVLEAREKSTVEE